MQFLHFPFVPALIIVCWPPLPHLHFLVKYPLNMLIHWIKIDQYIDMVKHDISSQL